MEEGDLRDLRDIEVTVFDLRSGEIETRQVQVAGTSTVLYVINELLELYPGTEVRLRNECLRLEEADLLRDVLDPDENLTALVKERILHFHPSLIPNTVSFISLDVTDGKRCREGFILTLSVTFRYFCYIFSA